MAGSVFSAVFGPDYFEHLSDAELIALLESIQDTYGEEAAINIIRGWNLMGRLEARGFLSTEEVARFKRCLGSSEARLQANRMITEIGGRIGGAADALVVGTLQPIMEAPHLDPDLVWRIARAYWHEVVYRGMEIGRAQPFWIKGIKEFPYEEVLVFAQHIWHAFKAVTGLDFTIPSESRAIKSWLSLSKRTTSREVAPDIHTGSMEERTDRLQRYIDYGGPSKRLMEGERQWFDDGVGTSDDYWAGWGD